MLQPQRGQNIRLSLTPRGQIAEEYENREAFRKAALKEKDNVTQRIPTLSSIGHQSAKNKQLCAREES